MFCVVDFFPSSDNIEMDGNLWEPSIPDNSSNITEKPLDEFSKKLAEKLPTKSSRASSKPKIKKKTCIPKLTASIRRFPRSDNLCVCIKQRSTSPATSLKINTIYIPKSSISDFLCKLESLQINEKTSLEVN